MKGVVYSLALLFVTLAPPAFPGEKDRAAIEAAAQRWIDAFNRGDAAAMAKLASEDVILMDASTPSIAGLDAARTAWQRASSKSGVELASTTKDLDIAGDVASRIVAFTKRNAGRVVSHGQALEVWKRENGAWKLHRQMSSGILAPPQILRRPSPSERVLDRARD